MAKFIQRVAAAILLVMLPSVVTAQRSGLATPDPYLLRAFGASDNFSGISYKVTSGLTLRSGVINPALKTLVLFTAGQSIWATTNPTLYTPSNSSVVDQFNIFDGALYSIGGPLLGTTWTPGSSTFGNLSARVADTLVTNAKFDRVILVPIAIGSTTVADWATGDLSSRVQVAMLRLAARGITPGMTGVTFALIYGQGEQDNLNGTSQAAWTASFATLKANILATGFNGRIFVPQETYINSTTSSAVRAAQASVVDNSVVYSGGDFDTLTGSTNRQNGGTDAHMTDAGAASVSTLMINAMHASGIPY